MHTTDVLAALSSAPVPQAPPGESGMAWLRASVSRFSNGATHERRRALVVAILAGVDPARLRTEAAAAARAAEMSSRAAGGDMVRAVPVTVLADAIGAPLASADDVFAVARAYHGGDDPAADAAVERLIESCGGHRDELTAARICLLVQASVATAGLVEAAVATGSVSEALRHAPPVTSTLRVVDGELVRLDLAAADLPFGAGPRECPGQDHALALAAGILDATRTTR